MDNKLVILEEKRKKQYKKYVLNNTIGVILVIIGIILYFVVFQHAVLIVIPSAIGAVFFGAAYKVKRDFEKEFTQEVVSRLVEEELPGSSFRQNRGISESECMVPGFFKTPDSFESNNLISAKYKGVPFEISNCVMKTRRETVDSKGNRVVTYEVYFKGRFIIVDYERDLDLIVKCLETTRLGANNRGLKSVELESILFNKKFKTFASEPHDAFYILTPHLQEKMLELEKIFKGTIFFSFHRGKMYLAINDSESSLTVRFSQPINDKTTEKLRKEINLVPSIINEFNLDSDKFKNISKI